MEQSEVKSHLSDARAQITALLKESRAPGFRPPSTPNSRYHDWYLQPQPYTNH